MDVSKTAQIILVMFLWAVCFPLITAGIQYAPHLTFAAIRAAIAGAALTALALALGRPWPRGPAIWGLLAAVGLGATSLGFLGMFHAAEYVSPGIATVIANTQPLLAALLASMFLGEHLGRRGKTGLVLGFAGIVVITWPRLFAGGGENYALGIAYITLAALGITVSNVLIKRIAGRVDGLMAMGIQMLIGTVPLMIAAWISEDPSSVRWSYSFIAILLALALFGTALVYWLWFSVLRTVPLSRANAFAFLIPVFGLAGGAMFFGEVLGVFQWMGMVLTVIGVGLVLRQ